ncbi:MAG: translocation/assembly module TamB domain-containing protein [Saprospiraceae bacterium]|nr:translocation/assembly module TamB domain-containing protein [Saprospiraceae bacterium]
MSETPPHIFVQEEDNTPIFEQSMLPKKGSFVRRILRGLMWIVLGILLLFIVLTLVLRIPIVQNWVIDKSTTYLSKELKTNVAIGSFSLDFLDELSVKNLYIGNQNAPKDTLLNIGALRVDINYLDLAWGIVQLDNVGIGDVTFRWRRDEGQYDDNFQFIIDYFDPPKPPTGKTPPTPDIRFAQIHLRNIDFTKDDKVHGQRLDFRLPVADIHTNIMNLPNKIMDLRSVELHKPDFTLTETDSKPMPPRPPRFPIKKSADSTKTLVQSPADSTNTPPPYKAVSKVKTKGKAFRFSIGAVAIEDGKFRNENFYRTPKLLYPDSLLDLDHFKVYDLNAYIHNFLFTKDEYTGVVDGISFNEASGFKLTQLSVGDAKVTPQKTELYGLQIITPYSVVGDTFIMNYPKGYTSFLDFNNQVEMDARIHASQVLIDDIMTFSNPLENNPFFRQNRYKNARIQGRVKGIVNKLDVPEFDIQLGDGFVAKGSLRSRDLNNPLSTIITLKLDNLQTNMPSLRQLVPDFKPVATFDQLGTLNYQGEFFGFTNSFVTKGTLQTALGNAALDLQLKPDSDSATAFYSGSLALEQFDVGKFTNNSDVGKVSLKTIIEKGRGVNLEKLNMDLVATVDNFEFKRYDYKNLKLSGNLSKQQFNGQFDSRDPNIDFTFDGMVDFAAAKPIFRFRSDIRQINFLNLNLLKQDLTTSGTLNINLTGRSIADMAGRINASNLLIIKNKTEKYALDTLSVLSDFDVITPLAPLGSKRFISVNSDILNAQIEGVFDLEDIPTAFRRLFEKYHPRFAADLGLSLLKNDPLSIFNGSTPQYPNIPQNFTFKGEIPNSKNWTKLFDKKLDTLRNITMEVSFDNDEDKYDWEVSTDTIHFYDDIKIVDFAVTGEANKDVLNLEFKTYNVVVGGKDFRNITLTNLMLGDTLEVGFLSHEFSSALHLDNVELNALVSREDSVYRINFGARQSSRLKIFGDFWDIDRNNFFLIGKNEVKIQGFNLTNDDRTIQLRSYGKRGLSAFLNNFDISFVNQFADDDRFTLGGKYHIFAAVEDAFNVQNYGVIAILDTFMVKGENRGSLKVEAVGTNLQSPIKANISLSTNSSKVAIEGLYYPSVSGAHPANSLDAQLAIQNLPFKTLQLLITEGASDFKGNVDGEAHVEGKLSELNTNGALRLRNAGVTVDYLKLPLLVKDETIRITNTGFDATGGKIYDPLGNSATVYGGLTHKRFLDFGLNVRIVSKNFMFMNTSRDDNPLFYGKAVGSGDVLFSRDFVQTDLTIRAKAGKGTNITFPFASEQTASDVGFVVFQNKNQPTSTTATGNNEVKQLSGLSLDMELSFTPDAEVNLIFDEVAGDNIKARGTGDMQIKIPRGGDVSMTGEYRIEQGDYLFTLLRVVNKKFAIKRGGTIRWNGTPFDATMNLNAQYNVTTAPYNFIAQYIADAGATSDIQRESRKPTPIALNLNLTGQMLKPDINFNMAFPNTQGQLKGYVESKLSDLRQDQNELNRQVFGLIALGGFLPSNSAVIGGDVLRSGGLNTATETASNIVSTLLNKLVSEYITGLDFQVGYNEYQYDAISSGSGTGGRQFRLRGSYAVDDKITVSGGVTRESGGFIQGNVFVGGDVIVDWSFSEDRRLKLRLSYTRDQVLEGPRDKTAGGLRFRQEFDSLEELLKSLGLR